VACGRGDYDAALGWYRKALEIFEQLGDPAGMAGSYHQLGNVAQHRGDHDAALGWYRQSLEIAEELGDRAGMALNLGQIGILQTKRGDPATGLSFNLQSLALHRQIGSSEIRVDLHWLARQRELLGQERFHALLIEHLGEEGAATVEQWLQQEPPEPPAGG
jgi:tetratricopeptide (TPR) repeat protein